MDDCRRYGWWSSTVLEWLQISDFKRLNKMRQFSPNCLRVLSAVDWMISTTILCRSKGRLAASSFLPLFQSLKVQPAVSEKYDIPCPPIVADTTGELDSRQAGFCRRLHRMDGVRRGRVQRLRPGDLRAEAKEDAQAIAEVALEEADHLRLPPKPLAEAASYVGMVTGLLRILKTLFAIDGRNEWNLRHRCQLSRIRQ